MNPRSKKVIFCQFFTKLPFIHFCHMASFASVVRSILCRFVKDSCSKLLGEFFQCARFARAGKKMNFCYFFRVAKRALATSFSNQAKLGFR